MLDLNTEYTHLRQRLEYLADDYSMIGIRYRNVGPSRYAIKDAVSDKAVWIHLSGIPKQHRSNRMKIIPTIHILPVDFFDSFSSIKQAGFPPPSRTTSDVFVESKPRSGDPDSWRMRAAVQSVTSYMDKQYYFDPTPLGYYTRRQHNDELGGTIGCSCNLCQGKNIDEFYTEYYHHHGATNSDKLKSHLVVHELISSFREFECAQEEIKQTSYRDYLYSKPAIASNLDYLPEIGNEPLDKFFPL